MPIRSATLCGLRRTMVGFRRRIPPLRPERDLPRSTERVQTATHHPDTQAPSATRPVRDRQADCFHLFPAEVRRTPMSERCAGTGSTSQIIAEPAGMDELPAWSSSGRQIAFYSEGPDPYGDDPRPGLWVSAADGGHHRMVFENREVHGVDW